MDHDGARALMATAVEGALSVEEERELALHLVGCVECKTLFEGLQHAQSALGRLAASDPPTRVLEAAVRRATTVLRGEADPGSSERAPGVPPPAHVVGPAPEFKIPAAVPPPTVEAPPAPRTEADLADAADLTFTDEGVPDRVQPPPLEPAPEEPKEEVRIVEPPPLEQAPVSPGPPVEEESAPEEPPPAPEPIEPAVEQPVTQTAPFDEPFGAEPFGAEPFADEPEPEEAAAELIPPRPTAPEEPPLIEVGPEPFAPAPPAGVPGRIPDLPVLAPEPYVVAQDPTAAALPGERQARRPGAGPWVVAIAATLALALLAGFLITRGQLFGGGGDAPDSDEVRTRVARVFAEMKSLKASFNVRRLDLYVVPQQDKSLSYVFSDGETTGRIIYDRAEGYREQTTVEVGGEEVGRSRLVKKADERSALIGTGGNARQIVDKNPPLGPPEGALHTSLGLLERSVSPIAAMIADASELEVSGVMTDEDREVIEVSFPVEPTELTRADHVVVRLDTHTYFPIHIRREISRSNAGVLGPRASLNDNAIATAFGDRDRVTTEIVDLADVIIDDIILPGDFVLDLPEGVQTETRENGYTRVSRGGLAQRLKFTPLFPRALPPGFEEQTLAVYSGTPTGWGPNNSYPAPDSILEASYFDGKTTIVLSERHMPDGSFTLQGSPVSTGGLPLESKNITEAQKTFTYAWSNEAPPHVYGFLGNVFVMVSGYAPQDQLVSVISSLVETPVEGPADLVSPSPGAASSPGAGLGTSPAPTLGP